MAVKTANVTARIQPEIKESAEAILEKLGIPVSVFIDMTYRQVIANNGVPFSVSIPRTITTRDEMTDTQFDSIMERGLMLSSILSKRVFDASGASNSYEI